MHSEFSGDIDSTGKTRARALAGLQKMDAGVLVRAVAISWVVLNHALSETEQAFSLAGGMSFLLFYSGYSFARFTLAKRDLDGIRQSLLTTIAKFLFPSVVLIAICFVWRNEWDSMELLHVSNFYSKEKIAYFPVWYVENIVQINLILIALFSLPTVFSVFKQHQLAFSFGVMLASVALIKYFDFDYLTDNRLPWFYIWLFALGWVVFFATQLKAGSPHAGKIVASLVLIAVTEYVYGPFTQILRPLWPIIGGLLLIWMPVLTVPALVKKTTTAVARATMFIFFLHAFIFGFLGIGANKLFGSKDVHFLVRWLTAMLVCVVLWALWTGFVRTFRLAQSRQAGNAVPLR